jgi:hypothetical protein
MMLSELRGSKIKKVRREAKLLGSSKESDMKMRMIAEALAEDGVIEEEDKVRPKPGENYVVVTSDKQWKQTPIINT